MKFDMFENVDDPELFWLSLAALGACAFVGELRLAWFLFFTHGWAVGWPFGLTFQKVAASVVTFYYALELFTAAVTAGAIVGLICALFQLDEKRQTQIFFGWLSLAGLAILCFSVFNFIYQYDLIGPEFPDL